MPRSRLVMLLCLLLLTLGVFAGCGSSNDDSKKGASSSSASGSSAGEDKPLAGKKIGMTPYWLDDANTIYLSSAKEYLESLGAKVDILNPNGDAVKQREQMQSFVSGHYDGIVLCPVNTGQLIPLLRMAQNAGIPTVLYWNTLPPDKMGGLKAPVFELDNSAAYRALGKQAVDYVKTVLKKEPKAIIYDDPSNPVLHARADGFEQGLKQADPSAKILFRDAVKFDVNGSRDAMQDLITKYPDFNIVAPDNGEASSGAWSALTAAGRGKAVNKVAKTEWFMFADPNNQRVQIFLDPSTSAIGMMMADFHQGGIEVGKSLGSLIQNPDWKNVSSQAVVPSRPMSPKCETAAKEFAEQNSRLKDYKPIDCSKLK